MPEMQQNGKTDDSAKVSNKEESAANHQIANLLLNLASRTQQQHMRAEPEVGPEPEAMDLSKYRKPKESAGAGSKAPSSSSFYSGMAGLGSPFLLQNLLMQQMSPAAVVGQAGVATTIPLMAGQIVAQLNSLLFAVHGVQDKGVELNVQGQLGAIYTRLQEIVTMIQHAKKRDPSRAVKTKEEPPSQLELHKQLELVTSTKEAEEQRIGQQLEEYQRALAGTTTASLFPQFPPSSPLSSSVASLLRKQKPPPAPEAEGPDPAETPAGPEEAVASRRGSRDSLDDSPPEKRPRMAEDTRPGSPASPPSGSRGSGSRSGKGGKGIRNRVFCGDCAGCLKNDDCGSCRYCRDKTKFGGQNRLRQKCLHRRCLLDSHRRSGAGGPGPQQGGDPGLYSGLEMARLQQPPVDHSIFSLLGGPAGRVPAMHSEEQEVREAREGSGEREAEQALSRSHRWKAKHEAMLKQAGEEARGAGQQVFESSSLVITLNEATRRDEGDADKRPRSSGLRLRPPGELESPGRLTRRGLKPLLAV